MFSLAVTLKLNCMDGAIIAAEQRGGEGGNGMLVRQISLRSVEVNVLLWTTRKHIP